MKLAASFLASSGISSNFFYSHFLCLQQLSFAIYPVAKMEGPQHMCLCLRITLNHCFVELKFGFYQECHLRGVAAIIGVAVTFVTEVASNTATANIVVIVIINMFIVIVIVMAMVTSLSLSTCLSFLSLPHN